MGVSTLLFSIEIIFVVVGAILTILSIYLYKSNSMDMKKYKYFKGDLEGVQKFRSFLADKIWDSRKGPAFQFERKLLLDSFEGNEAVAEAETAALSQELCEQAARTISAVQSQ
jgi:hypothetical protein